MHTDTSAGGQVVGPGLSGTMTEQGRIVLEGLHHCWVGSWASHGLLRWSRMGSQNLSSRKVSRVQGQTSQGQQLRTWGFDSGDLLQKLGLFLTPKS